MFMISCMCSGLVELHVNDENQTLCHIHILKPIEHFAWEMVHSMETTNPRKQECETSKDVYDVALWMKCCSSSQNA